MHFNAIITAGLGVVTLVTAAPIAACKSRALNAVSNIPSTPSNPGTSNTLGTPSPPTNSATPNTLEVPSPPTNSATPDTAINAGTAVSITPHDSYSSSVGVLGCKINTNRVAYWPSAVSCNDMCVKVSRAGRSVYLLKIDQSGGAYDISYDAWNYLSTGQSATSKPTQGGGIDAVYENVDMSNCADLLVGTGGKLAFSAANSMNFISSCLADSTSWLSKNYALYNIANSACTLGEDELCDYQPAVSNQPQCKSTLGIQTPMSSAPVYNIAYGSGAKVIAT